MVISNTGKNKIRDLIAENTDSAKIGTSGTSANVGDTDLGSAVVGIDKTPVITTNNKSVTYKYEIFSTEANGNTLKEGAIYFDDDVMLDRFVYPDYVKTENNAMVIIDIINIL